MQVLPIDLTAIIAIILGMLAILIPITGLTARFALKPLVESMARLFENRTVENTVEITERRVALLESQVESLEQVLRDLRDGREFDRQLQSPPPTERIGPGPHTP
jgi:hypothetical protein